MKANELSIGDWVQASTVVFQGEERLTPPMRVVGIGETWVYLEIDPEQGDPFEEDIKDIRPIPLTADILDSLSIENEENELILFYDKHKELSAMKIDPVSKEVTRISFSKPNFYVHDLQHAIRLAGIDNDIIL